MNEIFGEENFVACIVWQKRTSPDARASLGAAHDYIICFSKSLIEAKNSLKLLPLSDIRAGDYKNPDNDPRGAWASVDLTGQTGHATPSQYYEISLPAGERIKPPEGRCWAIAEETFKRLVAEGRIWFGKDGKARPRLKRFLSEAEGSTAWTWWSNAEVGHNQEGTKELIDIMGAADVFTNPKPTRLIKRMLQLTTSPETYDIILDFFAGSGTTADAVMQINNEEDGNRRFILIQLPEKAPEDSMARIAGYQHIAAICRERVRRVAERIDTEARERLDFSNGNSQDRGFKALQLTSSNFKLWNADEAPKDADGLAEQLRLYADHIMPGRSQEDILYELLLKAGLPLTAKVEQKELTGQKVFSVDDGRLVICLEDEITHETLRGMMELKPEMALCLDSAFKGNDQLKTNIVLEMESHEIKFHTV